MRTFFISLFAILLALQASVASATEMQYGVPAPTIFESQIQELQDGSLLITGVTFNNTIVDVYIDGVFNGRAIVANDDSGVASFAYKSFLPLIQGEHTIYAVARSLDETVRSKQSSSVSVVIPASSIAPTDIAIELDDAGKSTIVGNVLNGYEVEIFIEGRKFVSFTPPSSTGSVTSFWYKPGLPDGDYTVAIRSKSPEGVFSSFVSQVLTFGSPAYEKVSENNPNNDVMIVKKDDSPADLVVENTQDDVDPTSILDELEEQDEVVIVDEQNNDAKVVIDNTESKDKVVIDQNKTTEEIVVPTTKDDEVVVFGESDSELNSDINGGVSEVASESDTDSSRKTGFVLLLIVVIVLAIWYIREKQKALLGEKEAKDEENKDQITMDEIKEKIQHVVEEAKQEKQNDNTVSEQKKSNKKKKKNKKRRR